MLKKKSKLEKSHKSLLLCTSVLILVNLVLPLLFIGTKLRETGEVLSISRAYKFICSSLFVCSLDIIMNTCIAICIINIVFSKFKNRK